MTTARGPRPYLEPYAAGTLLGVVLFLAFFITGGGLGASGALSHIQVGVLDWFAPSRVDRIAYFAEIAGGSGIGRPSELLAFHHPIADLPGDKPAMGMAGEPGQLFGPVREGFGRHVGILIPRQRAGGAGGQRDFPRAPQEFFVGRRRLWLS